MPTCTSRAHWCPPAEFARVRRARGTTTVITDPHEIANASVSKAFAFMFEEAPKFGPLNHVGHGLLLRSRDRDGNQRRGPCTATSCFLKSDPWVLGLAEVMNYHGVIGGDDAVLEKIGAVPRKE